jgi:uncharacterized protein (TIGR02246 family)
MSLANRSRSWLMLAVSLAVLTPCVASAQGIEKPRVPIRTALDEIAHVRASYATAFESKDAATLATMYSPNAIVIEADGSVSKGRDAIRKHIEDGGFGKLTIDSDTTSVFGNTAMDVGTSTVADKNGKENTSHYLVVLRRGIKDWSIIRLALVPESNGMMGGDSASH